MNFVERVKKPFFVSLVVFATGVASAQVVGDVNNNGIIDVNEFAGDEVI